MCISIMLDWSYSEAVVFLVTGKVAGSGNAKANVSASGFALTRKMKLSVNDRGWK
jgi:hypothetical protein